MRHQLYFEIDIHFNVGPARVWDALTNPEKTKQYMYGCEISSDWEIGSPVNWVGKLDGESTNVIIGTLLDVLPLKRLEMSVFPPGVGIPDIPENYVTMEYTLKRKMEGTVLHVRLGDYALVAGGEMRYADTVNVWTAVAPVLVKIAESSVPPKSDSNQGSVIDYVSKLKP